MAKKPTTLPTEKLPEIVNRPTTGIENTALTAQPIEVEGFLVHPVSLAIQIMLEEINHPVIAFTSESAKPLNPHDIIKLLFIFVQPKEAYENLGYSREKFEVSAQNFALSVPSNLLPKFLEAIKTQMKGS